MIVTLDREAPVVAKLADFGHALLELPPSGGELLTWQHLAPEILSDFEMFYDHRFVFIFIFIFFLFFFTILIFFFFFFFSELTSMLLV